MRKIINIFLLLFIANAQDQLSVEDPKQLPNNSSPSTKNSIYELGLGMEFYQYEEPNIMQITGSMLKFNVTTGTISGIFSFQNDLYFATHIGLNVYDGGIVDKNKHVTPYSTKSTDYYAGIVPKIGIGFFGKKK